MVQPLGGRDSLRESFVHCRDPYLPIKVHLVNSNERNYMHYHLTL